MRTEVKTIESKREYSLTIATFPVLKSQRILLQLAQMIGGDGAQLVAAIQAGQKGVDLVPRLIGMLRQLSPVDFEDMLGVLLSRCTVKFTESEGKDRKVELATPQGVDLAFGDDVRALYLAVGAVLEVNYTNFLEEFARILVALPGAE